MVGLLSVELPFFPQFILAQGTCGGVELVQQVPFDPPVAALMGPDRADDGIKALTGKTTSVNAVK